jgi:hypothetical protein
MLGLKRAEWFREYLNHFTLTKDQPLKRVQLGILLRTALHFG